MSHEAMYPAPPVTHTRRGAGGDAISANHPGAGRPARCSFRALMADDDVTESESLMASLRCADKLTNPAVFVLRNS